MAAWRLAATVWAASDLLVDPSSAPSPSLSQHFWKAHSSDIAPEAVGTWHRGSKSAKGPSRIFRRNLATILHRVDVPRSHGCHLLENFATISQPTSVNIRLYLLTNRRCLYNEPSSRQYHYFPHGVLTCSGTEDEDTLHYPYTSRSKSAYVLSFAVLMFCSYRVAMLCFSFLDIQTLRSLLSCRLLWGSMTGGAAFRTTRWQVDCCDGGGVYPPFPFPGPMIGYTGSWDERAETCRLCIEQKFPFCARRIISPSKMFMPTCVVITCPCLSVIC